MLLVFFTSYVGRLWVYFSEQFFCGSFWISVVFSISHQFRYAYFFKASIHFDSHSFMDWRGFLSQNPWLGVFEFVFFVCVCVCVCCSNLNELNFRLWSFFESIQLFFHVYPFGFSVMISAFSYLFPKLFCFPCIWLLVSLLTFFPYSLVSFFHCLKMSCLVCDCLILCWYLFSLHSLARNFLFIFLSSSACSNFVASHISSQHIIIIIIYSFRVFHISVSWWFFSWAWVIASLLKSPGFFSVMLSFR